MITALQERTMELANYLFEKRINFKLFKKANRVAITANIGGIYLYLWTSEGKCNYGSSNVWYVFSSYCPYDWGEELSIPKYNRKNPDFTYKLWNHDMTYHEIILNINNM